jgi:Sulfotransferase family
MKHRPHPIDGGSMGSSSGSSDASPQPRPRVQTRERRRRKKFVQTRGLDLGSIPEEVGLMRRSTTNENPWTSLMLPLLVILATTAMLVGSPDQWKNIRFHRTLLTLTLEHVGQYPFDNFLEVSDVLTQEKTVGFYWQVPRCGGTTLKHIMGTCLKRVQAARAAADYCDMNSDELALCKTKSGIFINADPSDHLGIQRSDKMGLVPSGMADVVVSSRILHAATLFDQEHKGRIFTVLRDPVERAVSTFYYLQNAYWERHYRPEYKDMTVLDYAALPDTSNNWMTRWLTGKNAEPHLTRDDLAFAKELLRRKFLILLTEEMSTSVQRLMHYMGWEIADEDRDEARECLLAATSKKGGHNKNEHNSIDKESAEYQALSQINSLDIELYEYAKELFVEQWSVLNRKGSPFDMEKINSLFIEGNNTSPTTSLKKATSTSNGALPLEVMEMLAATELSKDAAKEASTSGALAAALKPLGINANGGAKGISTEAKPESDAGTAVARDSPLHDSQGISPSIGSVNNAKQHEATELPNASTQSRSHSSSMPSTLQGLANGESQPLLTQQRDSRPSSTFPVRFNGISGRTRDVQESIAGEFMNTLTKKSPVGEETQVMPVTRDEPGSVGEQPKVIQTVQERQDTESISGELRIGMHPERTHQGGPPKAGAMSQKQDLPAQGQITRPEQKKVQQQQGVGQQVPKT